MEGLGRHILQQYVLLIVRFQRLSECFASEFKKKNSSIEPKCLHLFAYVVAEVVVYFSVVNVRLQIKRSNLIIITPPHTPQLFRFSNQGFYIWKIRAIQTSYFQMILCQMRDVHNVTVIVVGSGLGYSSSNPGRSYLHFTLPEYP